VNEETLAHWGLSPQKQIQKERKLTLQAKFRFSENWPVEKKIKSESIFKNIYVYILKFTAD
jgi:hypothetical protein